MGGAGDGGDDGLEAGAWPGRAAAVLVLVGVAVLLFLAIRALVPAKEPRFTDPSFIEVIFANRLVVTLARVALLAAVLYIVVSVVALVSRGQWISGVGPIRVSDSVRTVEQERNRLRSALKEAVDKVETLEDQLHDARDQLADAQRRLEAGQDDRRAGRYDESEGGRDDTG